MISPLDNDIAEFLNCPRAFQNQGVRFGRDFTFTSNQKPYFNAGIFLDSIRTVFLQDIDSLRGMAVLAQELTISLIDDCSAYVRNDVIVILIEARGCVITFAPHPTQTFQLLVLTRVGVPKGCPRYELPFDDDNATVKLIMNVYHGFTQTMLRSNVRGAFSALLFELDARREPDGLLFDEVKLRERAGFQELLSVDFPVDQISGPRCIAQFGWINKLEEIHLTSVALCFAHDGPGYLPLSENEQNGIWRRSAHRFVRFALYWIL
jgi:hypothetical protein